MSRAERLLNLLQLLRSRRTPVSAATLADQLQISVRSVYRDIRSLQAQGAPIDGEAGLGYLLRPGFLLPPLMFTGQELQALVLGSRWVHQQTDSELAEAAKQALAKISAGLPADKRFELEHSALLVGPAPACSASDKVQRDLQLKQIRYAISRQQKLQLIYRNGQQQLSERVVWPIALGFFQQVQLLVVWCELRQQYRHLRLDRIVTLTTLPEDYPGRRAQLLTDWRRTMNIQTPW